LLNSAPHTGHLSPDAHVLLRSLKGWCQTNQVRLVYSLPWCYTPTNALIDSQRLNARLLFEVAEYLPVLRDEKLGAHPVLEHFADTEFHLNQVGAELRTEGLASQLASWRVWTRDELQSRAQGAARPSTPSPNALAAGTNKGAAPGLDELRNRLVAAHAQ
jgi:hypothetical protein